MKDFWNERYQQDSFIYGKQPNTFFAEHINLLEPGTLLLPAEGEGRNAVYAASLGWDVTAFDFSEAARQKAEKLAAEAGVDIHYQLSQAADFQAEAESFDVVALIYAHLPPLIRKEIHRRLVSWLKPGGRVILEAFHPRQLQHHSGGPKNPEMLYDKDMLRNDFPTLKEILLQEQTIHLAEGDLHQGEAEVVRFVGKKEG